MNTELVTFNCLEKWFEHLAEKTGWMLLGLENGNSKKLLTHIDNFDHLIKDIQVKINSGIDSFHLKELEILVMNASKLRNTLAVIANNKNHFGSQSGGAKKSSKKSSKKSKKILN